MYEGVLFPYFWREKKISHVLQQKDCVMNRNFMHGFVYIYNFFSLTRNFRFVFLLSAGVSFVVICLKWACLAPKRHQCEAMNVTGLSNEIPFKGAFDKSSSSHRCLFQCCSICSVFVFFFLIISLLLSLSLSLNKHTFSDAPKFQFKFKHNNVNVFFCFVFRFFFGKGSSQQSERVLIYAVCYAIIYLFIWFFSACILKASA